MAEESEFSWNEISFKTLAKEDSIGWKQSTKTITEICFVLLFESRAEWTELFCGHIGHVAHGVGVDLLKCIVLQAVTHLKGILVVQNSGQEHKKSNQTEEEWNVENTVTILNVVVVWFVDWLTKMSRNLKKILDSVCDVLEVLHKKTKKSHRTRKRFAKW